MPIRPNLAKLTVAETALKPRSRTAKILVAILGLAVFACLLGLGTWQVQRLHWKESLLQEITDRHALPPVSLEDILTRVAKGEAVDYRPVTVTGTFDHAKERYFLATLNGDPGYHVYTPMTLPDGRILFVNRGFVPMEKADPATRQSGNPQATVTIMGLARDRLAAKPSSLVPDNDLAKNIFFWKDLDAMAKSTGYDPSLVLPLFVDADATPNPGGFPVGAVTIFDLPNNHLQYAVTWYGLAAALVLVAGVMLFKGRQSGAR
jgi:surfeit locus 1 family protein